MIKKFILALFLTIIGILSTCAENVVVNVSPKRPILPPQVMLYVSNPGQYFNISIQNNESTEMPIYFGLELRQINPVSDLEVIVPGGPHIPRTPIVVGANQTMILDAVAMRTMFNHVSAEDITVPAGLFDNVLSGSFGNLPEGDYEVIFHAYKWNPSLSSPVLVNNPMMSKCTFKVCYQAQIPQWISPAFKDDMMGDIYKLDTLTPMFVWTQPTTNCATGPRSFFYNFKVVQLMPNQSPDHAIDNNPVSYQINNLVSPQCIIPTNVIKNFSPNETYVAQITASSNSTQVGALDYIELLNSGKTELRMFRLSGITSQPSVETHFANDKATVYSPPRFTTPKPFTDLTNRKAFPIWSYIKWDAPEISGVGDLDKVAFTYNIKMVKATQRDVVTIEDLSEDLENGETVLEKEGLTADHFEMPVELLDKVDTAQIYVVRVTAIPDTSVVGKNYVYQNEGKSVPALVQFKSEFEYSVSEDDVADYTFVNPEILDPVFDPEAGARKLFTNSDMTIRWNKPQFSGGTGLQSDTIKFAYDVELFRANEYIEREQMLTNEHKIYQKQVVDAATDTIPWKLLDEKIKKGDYVMLRVKPVAVNDSAVVFINDSINVIDFAMTESMTKRYFQCANKVVITNEKPTTKKADELKGKSIYIGEYELVLDGKLKDGTKPGTFSGTGHVIWEPLLMTWKLAVKFDNITVNTDDLVIDGLVETFEGDKGEKLSSAEVVDKLFSDWGIDNLIGDTGLPYADKLQGAADKEIKNLAAQLNIGEYYADYQKGKFKLKGLFSGNLEDVTFPLEIPEDINPTPVNLTISKMKFAPTHATMDVFGTFVVPETEATKDQILVFGAPRLCISPKSLLPEGGTIALLKDFEVQEPKSGFKCKFLAPEDVLKPNNGCFVSWSEGKFEWLNIDLDMTMPDDLRKVNSAGTALDESPKLHVTTKIVKWEDFIATATMDPFEHKDLPGYVFTAEKVVVDIASGCNHESMKSVFPKDYDYSKANLDKTKIHEWTGLYMKELSMMFPSSIKIGNGKERMKVAIENMLIDKSGVTMDCGIVNAINYKHGENGTIGGFKFSMDSIMVSVIQNDFVKFGFNGTLQIPLLEGEINYSCRIYNQTFTKKGTGKGYAYVFKTSQITDLDFDFVLGKLALDKDMTYLLVEATPDEAEELKTNVELCIGGTVDVAGKDKVNGYLAKLPFKITMPGIKFSRMRIANNESFESVYESEMQQKAQTAILAMDKEVEDSHGIWHGWFNEGKNHKFGESTYVNFGQWGAASPQKKIGPFIFALTDWGFNLEKGDGDPKLVVTIGGDITFSDDLDITAGTTLDFVSTVKNLNDFSNIKIDFDEVRFNEARLAIEADVFSFKGTLSTNGNSGGAKSSDKGYKGELEFKLKGGLFELQIMGGYFDHEAEEDSEDKNYSWGFFMAKAGGKCGIPIPPIQLNNIKGGVYINCQYNQSDELNPKPTKGAIGIIFGLGIATADGVTVKGDLELVVAFNHETKKLNSLIFTGGVKAVGGMIDSKVKLQYEDNEKERYFRLNLSMETSLSNGLNDFIGDWASGITEKYGDAEEGMSKALDDTSDKGGKSEEYDERMNKYEEKQKEDKNGVKADGPGAKIELEIYIGCEKTTVTMQGKNGAKITSTKDGPTKWYVYLGRPKSDQRCRFILIDFNSKIVSVSIGADAYLCLGNELPDNGELPPIPEKVAKFLDGAERGVSKSDNKSDADAAREKALVDFGKNAKISGGVMLGASIWGYINVNLGLFYGDMGATAGFDVSVVHLENADCVNLGKKPGHNGWYGRGQLYAYLYAKFGLRINLGFFKKKIDLVDVGIGGVLKCALPNPNYFTGKARCKIRLLGGLVNLNKSFKFECGQQCDLFMGNALDDYKVFENLSIGVDKADEAVKAPIDWEYQSPPVITTQPTLGNTIRVVDPTVLNQMISSSSAPQVSEDAFNEFASRSFKFVLVGRPILYEYSSKSDFVNGRHNNAKEMGEFQVAVNREKVTLRDFKQLNKNRYYRLHCKAKALEYYNGKWQNPEEYDTIKHKYFAKEWVQEKDFYFVTNNKVKEYQDDEDLEPHVKIAFPWNHNFNKCVFPVNNSREYVHTHLADARMPMISLGERMKGKCYNKGRLNWYVYKGGKPRLAPVANNWVENDSVSMLMPAQELSISLSDKTAIVRLIYEWDEKVESQATWVPVGNTYEVIGASFKEVYDKEVENMKKRYGITATNSNKGTTKEDMNSRIYGKYRLDVQQATYIDDEDEEETGSSSGSSSSNSFIAPKGTLMGNGYTPTGKGTPLPPVTTGGNSVRNKRRNTTTFSNNSQGGGSSKSVRKLKFKVTVYELKKGVVNVHHEKVLAQWHTYLKDDRKTGDDYFNNKYYYGAGPVLATQLVMLYKDKSYSNGQYPTYLTNLKSKEAKLPSYTGKDGKPVYLVTQNPFLFMTYLSRAYFVGGSKFVSAKNNLNISIQNTLSMTVESPYAKWTNNQLGELGYEYLSICDMTMFTRKMSEKNYYIPYPIYAAGDWDVQRKGGASAGLFRSHELSEKAYAQMLLDYYNLCGGMSERVNYYSNLVNGFSKSDMRNWLALKGNSKLTLSGYVRDEVVDEWYPILEVPYYQFGIVYNVAGKAGLNPDKTIEDKGTRHERILKHKKNHYTSARIFYNHCRYNNVPKDFQPGWTHVEFDPERIAKENDYKMYLYRYRINAWNFRKGRWTVHHFNSNVYNKPAQFFEKYYTVNFLDLVKKYNLKFDKIKF